MGLFIVRSVEKYLNDEGTFAFVTPLAVLSRQQYEGFRAGIWGDTNVPHLRGHITEMWDLDKVRPHPFPVPAAVVYGTRYTAGRDGQLSTTPHGVPATKIEVRGLRNPKGWTESLKNFTFAEVRNTAISADDEESPYRKSLVNGATIFPRCLFFVTEEEATHQLGQSAGRVNIRSYRTNQEKEPWKSIPDLTGVVQRRYIFDVHLGSTIAPFRQLQPWRAILPISDNMIMDEDQLKAQAPGVAKWWDEASDLWEQNKTKSSRLSLIENLDYHSKLTRQLGAVKHRVVYTKAGTRLAASRLDDQQQIVDHKLYWLPVRSKQEAQYLTAILNAPVTTEAVALYQSRGLYGGRDFDAYVWRLPIPIYDPKAALHTQLVQLSEEAEIVAEQTDIGSYGFQKARGLIRDKLQTEGVMPQIDEAVADLLGIVPDQLEER